MVGEDELYGQQGTLTRSWKVLYIHHNFRDRFFLDTPFEVVVVLILAVVVGRPRISVDKKWKFIEGGSTSQWSKWWFLISYFIIIYEEALSSIYDCLNTPAPRKEHKLLHHIQSSPIQPGPS